MILLPLRYCETIIGHAKVDDDMEILQSIDYYSVTIPRALRRQLGHRTDIILASLIEDDELRRKLRPFINYAGAQIQLSHLVLRESLINTVFGAFDLAKCRELMVRPIVVERVIHVNDDHTDCQRDNLRELETAHHGQPQRL